MKHILSLLISIPCIIILVALYRNGNHDSIVIVLIAVFIAVELLPRIKKICQRKKYQKKSIEAVKKGENCIIEELGIMLSPNLQENLLTISNMPNWIYRIGTYNADEQLDILVSDFERIRKNSDWNEFIKGKTVIFNLYSDEYFNKLVLKTIKKKYN